MVLPIRSPEEVNVNVLIVVGSPDGLLGGAAVLRYLAHSDLKIDISQICLIITQAFKVNQINPFEWMNKSRVGLVDVAVNSSMPSMTEEFIKRITQAGHSILFIADEHCRDAWGDVLNRCSINFDSLSIQPQSRNQYYGSSCAILKEALGDVQDPHLNALLRDGDLADRMIYQGVASYCKYATIGASDVNRRVILVRHFVENAEPNEMIKGWIQEGIQLEANHVEIIENRFYLGHGIFRYNGNLAKHDATLCLNLAYKYGPFAILVVRNNVIIATNSQLNILQTLKNANVPAKGNSFKATLTIHQLHPAVAALQSAILSQKELLTR